MAFATFAHGPYSATLNAVALGLTEGPMRLSEELYAEVIRADKYGQATLDAIALGKDSFISIILKEWTTGAQNAIFQLAGVGATGLIGRNLSDIAQSLVLTALASTPAAVNGPVTVTASKAVLAPGYRREILLGNVQRNTPIIFQLLPTESSSLLTHFSVT